MKIIKITEKPKTYPYKVFYRVDGQEKPTFISFEARNNYEADMIAKGMSDFYDYPNAYVRLNKEELDARKARIKHREESKNLGNNWWDD